MNPYLGFGPGRDPVAWTALALAALAGAACLHAPTIARIERAAPRTIVGALALTALALSAGYVAYYLRGGPRIVDAAYYYLEARTLASGHLTFAVPEPLAAFHGRFLLSAPGGGALGVLFPPGYPAALAAAFVLGAPLALGPMLAALLVAATYWLTRELGGSANAARAAAALSALSAALRYHTADTMSHGLAALLVASSVAGAARASSRSLLAAGLAAGFLCATRPVSGVVTLAIVLWLASRARRRVAWLALGVLPGVAFLLVSQRALTGEWLRSTQAAYYALADGPPGCFRYGFGAPAGCWFEHGDYVRARLPHGYGASEALATTLRRLGVHCLDIANAAPLAAGVVLGAWTARKQRAARAAALLVAGIVLAYAPFYFEGSYPGGGARFFADALPLEHALIALGLSSLGVARFALPLSLLGFGLHTSAQHRLLAERDGGRPMFEPRVLAEHGVTRGLVFVTTDHGFALGHDPAARTANSASTGVIVARARGDGLDAMLWQNLGRPAAYVYRFDTGAGAKPPALSPWTPGAHRDRIEAEHLWPVAAARSGWAHPDFTPIACASAGRGLRLRSDPSSGATEVTLELPRTGAASLFRLGWIADPGSSATTDWAVEVEWSDGLRGRRRQAVRWERGETAAACRLSAALGPLPDSRRLVTFRSLRNARTGDRTDDLTAERLALLDYVELTVASADLSKSR